MLVLAAGLCVQPDAKPYWTSDSPADREQARRIFLACPVRLPWCHDWALSLPRSAAGDVILAGLGAAGRMRARRTGWR
jgi:hypothetical protein